MIQIALSKIKITFSLILLIAMLCSCIEEYEPEINESADLLVIQGSIIREDTLQYVEISRSAPYGDPFKRPVSDCNVQVIDQNGRVFSFTEQEEGSYTAEIDQQFLQYGNKFVLRVTTPNNNIYESVPETILEGSPIDTLYYANEPYQSSSEYFSEGLQIYADLKAPNENTRNYRWTIEETWEYRSSHVIDAYWDDENDTLIQEFSIDYYTCWQTMPVSGFYSASTENLLQNEKKRVPLNYVPGEDWRLGVKYCAHVKQFSLGDDAFEYWNKNKVETTETGGLYQTQPSQSKSNIYNIEDPDEIVLGYFWASSYNEDFVFYSGPFKPLPPNFRCEPDTIDINHVGVFIFNTYYKVLQDLGDSAMWGTADEGCFDCRLRGGTIHKPDFWE